LKDALGMKGLMMNRTGIVMAVWIFVCVFIFSSHADAAKYYKYKDSKGRVHLVDRPDKIPKKYRDRFEVTELKHGKIQTVPERWFVFGMSLQEVKDVNFPGLVLYAAHTSRAVYWLAGELIALVVFLVCLFMARDFPTRAERRRLGLGAIILYLVWLIISLPLGLRPSALEFCRTSRAYLAFVREDNRVPPSLQDRAGNLGESFLSIQDKIP